MLPLDTKSLGIKAKLKGGKDRLKGKLKDKLNELTLPKITSKEFETQLLAYSVSRMATRLGGMALSNSMDKDADREFKQGKSLTSKDIQEAIKNMDLNKKPIVVRDSPLAGGTNAFVHPINKVKNWMILRALKKEDRVLHSKVKKQYEDANGKNMYAMHLGKDIRDIGTVGHELGHIKLREVLEEKLGKYPGKALAMTRALSADLPFMSNTPITGKATALKTLTFAPMLADEYIASHLSKKKMKGITKADKKSLNKAFGTYLLGASTPLSQKLSYDLLKKLSK